jgi:hypothetical protein
MKRLLAAVGALGAAVCVASAVPPAPPAQTPPPAPAELVLRLGSADFREREHAAAALERAGAAALAALRDAAKSSDPEIRLRAAPILVRVQRGADSASRLVPKKVALNYTDVGLGTALADLKARTGLNVELDLKRVADPLRKVTCATGEVSAWEALEAFCTAAGLREAFASELDVPKPPPGRRPAYTPPAPAPTPDAVPITLIDGKGPGAPGSRNTAVRILALPPSFPGHRVTLGTGETTLCFDVLPAPDLNWQEVVAVKITKLTDGAGRAGGSAPPRHDSADGGPSDVVVAFGGPGVVAWGGGFGGRFDPNTGMPIYPDAMPNPRVVPVPLKLATPDARTIKRLEGVVLGEIVLAEQPLVTVTDPVKQSGRTFDGPGRVRLTVAAGGAPTAAIGPTLQVTMEYPAPWAVAARRGWNPGGIWPVAPRPGNQPPALRAYDAAGKQMHAQRNDVTFNNSFDGVTMQQTFTLQFAKGDAAPAKLVLVGPRPMTVEVPFVMDNVPLP